MIKLSSLAATVVFLLVTSFSQASDLMMIDTRSRTRDSTSTHNASINAEDLASVLAHLPDPQWVQTMPTAQSTIDALRVTPHNASFPISFEFSSSTRSTYTPLMAGLTIPYTSHLFQVQGIAGYILNKSPNSNSAVIYAQWSAGVNGASGDAVNAVCTNGNQQVSSGAGFMSYSAGNVVCIEGDTNVFPLAGGGQPSSNVYGVLVSGGSTTQPAGIFDAVHVGVQLSTQWKNAIFTEDGASGVGLSLGTINKKGMSSSSSLIQRYNTGSGTGEITRSANSSGGIVERLGATGASYTITDGRVNLIQSNSEQTSIAGTIMTEGLIAQSDVTAAVLHIKPQTFATVIANYPCNKNNAGTYAAISDSSTPLIAGTPAAGGSPNHDATIKCNAMGTGYFVVGF